MSPASNSVSMPHFTDISMKNFSTVGARLAAAALFARRRWPRPAQAAADLRVPPNAPDQHLVVKGDTLWDISGNFLEHPWCWPQVWGMNKEEIKQSALDLSGPDHLFRPRQRRACR